eukprot:CAMPEP_0172535028 /NCGR_PEP_ID=MMETSP1067-20121228/7195_1 /TAXON_ID=265564 ORGANISM="Thalassiosira punctigera, Strain Tpunct2005C2" /NCGR_SAMPLE_ID=MMETSP1067 /ASSEMBLY_ACC=CAM_ASM_000444 /LENGTH=758 /DNA_ID=CAMNT_0013319917 /DNA_START=197 /DNA_END=2473 /DNA_ORIENTATION=-
MRLLGAKSRSTDQLNLSESEKIDHARERKYRRHSSGSAELEVSAATAGKKKKKKSWMTSKLVDLIRRGSSTFDRHDSSSSVVSAGSRGGSSSTGAAPQSKATPKTGAKSVRTASAEQRNSRGSGAGGSHPVGHMPRLTEEKGATEAGAQARVLQDRAACAGASDFEAIQARVLAKSMPPRCQGNQEARRCNSRAERRMSRRARTNVFNGGSGKRQSMFRGAAKFPFHMEGAMRMRTGNSHIKNSGDLTGTGDNLVSVLLKSLDDERLCDVEIVGKDEVGVQAPSFLLAAHSEVFKEMFYSKKEADDDAGGRAAGAADDAADDDDDDANILDSLHDTTHTVDDSPSHVVHRVRLSFATWDATNAALHFLVARELPDGLESDPNEVNMRTVCQMHLLGRAFKIPSLANGAYRTARLFMNKVPRLVCAAFDECVVSSNLLGGEYRLPKGQDELLAYALEYMRESPLTTLLSEGTIFLSINSIEAILRDQEMDMDETTMFHVLNSWVKQDEDCNKEAGRALVPNINLSYIKTDYLNNVVRKCGFVDVSDVEVALKEIEENLANQPPDEKEHVFVEGAGEPDINGIYVRMEEDIGLGVDEMVFIKECQEDEDYCPDYGLYLMKMTWAITPLVDYSSILYSCEVSGSSSTRNKVPSQGWETDRGKYPPPTCTWKASKDAPMDNKGYVAPNLKASVAEKKLLDVADWDHDEGKTRISLTTMLNLPTDEGHENDDYHDDIDDSNTDRVDGSITSREIAEYARATTT